MAKTMLSQKVTSNKGRALSSEFNEMDNTLTTLSKMYEDLAKQVRDCRTHSGHLAGYGVRVAETMEAFSTIPGFEEVAVFSDVQRKQMDFVTSLSDVMEEILMEGIKEVQQEIETAKKCRKQLKNDKLAVDAQDSLVAKYREKQNMDKLPAAQAELERMVSAMSTSEEGFIYMVNSLMQTHARVYGAVMQQYFISVQQRLEEHMKVLKKNVENFEPIQYSFSAGTGGVSSTTTTSSVSTTQEEEAKPSAPPLVESDQGGQDVVTAAYDFSDDGEDSLAFAKGDKLVVLQKSDSGWWLGEHQGSGAKGWFPSNFVE
eukprot:TRINITY_DN32587_c0_g1_i1.p1 TRINITY_DN32587_c0_g1~~TRINITY_DN32587_c0_g1_i1.p1  ORF type:complete len:315 (+),score=112.24 TRINITY_DN32587_c0_g1_i1:51-995(+)